MRSMLAFCVVAISVLGNPLSAQADQPPESNVERDDMSDLKEFYATMSGEWSGTYHLWLEPGTDAHVSQTNARVSMEANGVYPVMTYDWIWKETPQSGVFLFEGSSESVIATWGDSWHQQPATMRCEGAINEDGKMVLLGSYGAGEGPDWGWRTVFGVQDSNSMVMEVYNITPEGQEALAVRAEYTRSAVGTN